MHTLNSTLKVDSISSVMAEMGKEMMKAGLIEEIISDGLEDATEVDTTDEEVNLELEKIMKKFIC
jgi:charged multivesicular body protein 3